ncbi:hypothetical protein QTP70_025513 [Hemibagrus guttatus]|uniref:Chemokine interleukin-8-like domain-containing protein n=1 Tax=Hemibagrus guttatus TaxID=175788 RepID=A0AAE0QZ30_9TELE|nr:hypothetical protein QTP70_025513 [Hemibagrus guttatus]
MLKGWGENMLIYNEAIKCNHNKLNHRERTEQTPAESMKTSCVFFFLGLIAIMVLSSDAIPHSFDTGACCFKFFTGKINPKVVLEVKETDSRCAQQGFIVKMAQFNKLCVQENPRKRN